MKKLKIDAIMKAQILIWQQWLLELRSDKFMNKQQIIDLLNIGEHREVEFKESYKKLPKSLWETYSSFANTRGRSNYFRNKRR